VDHDSIITLRSRIHRGVEFNRGVKRAGTSRHAVIIVPKTSSKFPIYFRL
jgi:hypothetical protein